jgi:hypothetical protein
MSLIEVKQHFSHRELLWFGPIVGLFVAIVGSMLVYQLDMEAAAYALWAAAAVVLITYYARPTIRVPVMRGWIHLFLPIGWVMSHVLLAAIYYAVLTPIGLVMRVCGYDPMQRALQPTKATYWVARTKIDEPQRCFKQY